MTVLTRTMAVAYYDHELVALIQTEEPGSPARPRERLWLVRAGKVVLATGAIEQPLVFDNNDRPEVMLAGAARTYLQRHSIAPGRAVVVATNNDSAYPVARALREAGVNVTAVVDSRDAVPVQLMGDMRGGERSGSARGDTHRYSPDSRR